MAIIEHSVYRRLLRSLKFAALWPALLVWVLTTAMDAPFQTISKEYQVKAVFLFNFTQFVDWPANAFTDAKAPLVIGIWGANPFGNYLKETLNGETMKGRPLVIQYCHNIQDAKKCHILFLNEHAGEPAEQVLTGLKGKAILTVSDAGDFIQQGGMIRFFTENNKIRMQINPAMANAANLNISSGLLRLAQIVDSN